MGNRAARKRATSHVRSLLTYLKNRLEERSTWAAIAAGITGASVLDSPFNWLAIAAASIGALVPTKSPEDRA
jgi:hypothetical protein